MLKCPRVPVVLCSVFYCLLSLCPGLARAQEWQELKSGHFIVYFTEDSAFARDVSRRSEVYYRRIASELGYQRYSGFWTWDNRVKVYIYPDRISYLKATGQPQWSDGVANYTQKSISSYVSSANFLEGLLPHEMTHLIFRDYVGFTGEIPLWLDEGVAQWMEPDKRELVKTVIQRMRAQGILFSVPQMMRLDIRQSNNDALVQAYYVQAVSLVGFLVEKYGTVRFTNFCRGLRDGKSVEDALTSAYPLAFRDLTAFEEKWKAYLEEEGK